MQVGWGLVSSSLSQLSKVEVLGFAIMLYCFEDLFSVLATYITHVHPTWSIVRAKLPDKLIELYILPDPIKKHLIPSIVL